MCITYRRRKQVAYTSNFDCGGGGAQPPSLFVPTFIILIDLLADSGSKIMATKQKGTDNQSVLSYFQKKSKG